MTAKYVYQQAGWPSFTWDKEAVFSLLAGVRNKQGRVRGSMEALGFAVRSETNLQTLTQDVLKSTEIEGEFLDAGQVRSSVARHLGMDAAGLPVPDRHVDGVVEMMLDATQHYNKPLTKERLCGWHAALFPTGRSGMHKITVGNWRKSDKGPMQVVSGAMGKEKVHFEAPDSKLVPKEMQAFMKWFNTEQKLDPVLRSALAHLWFVTVHPFDDGNGRMARALADMQLARADEDTQRFYSMSSQLRSRRKEYYEMLERTQKGGLDVTRWLVWYLDCLHDALSVTEQVLSVVMGKTRFWDTHAQTPVNERQRKMINRLFDGFEGKLTSSKWAKMCKCSHDTALRDINELLSLKVLKKEAAGGRSTSYVLK